MTNLSGFLDAMKTGGEVVFGQSLNLTLSNQVVLTRDATLRNGGHNVTVQGVGGTNGGRLFNVRTGVSFTISGITLQNGRATNGGAIYNRGTLVVSNCNFRNNSAVGRNGGNGANRPDSSDSPRDGGAGGAGNPARGGAVFSSGRATFIECTFEGNSATGGNGGNGGKGGNAVQGAFEGGDSGAGGNGGVAQGGAIYNSSVLTVRDCTFRANRVTGGNAGQAGEPGTGPVPGLRRSGGQGGVGLGGAIHTARRATITASTLTGNTSTGGDSGNGGVQQNGDGADGQDGGNGAGGAVSNTGTNTMVNCTFFRNRVFGGKGGAGGNGGFEGGDGGRGGEGMGGCVYNAVGRTELRHCTVSTGGAFGGPGGTNGTALVPGSQGSAGSNLGGNVATATGRIVLVNSILEAGAGGGNGFGTIVDGGGNISSDNSIALPAYDSSTNLDPRLEPLEENGGPTETMALRPNSPAVDGARLEVCEEVDQRGTPRPFGAGCDSGAFEFQISAIHGRVTDAATNGIGGIVITVNNTLTNQTDPDGYYSFLDLEGGTYVVTAFGEGYRFQPPSYTLELIAEEENVDFIAIPLPVVTGRVMFVETGLSNVMVSAGTNTTLTDTNGEFRLSFPSNTTVTIRPALDGYEFEPPSVSLTVYSNIGVGPFAARTTISLGGRITDTVALPVANVAVSAGGRQATTDAAGYYEITQLSRDGTYEVRPTLNGYQFNPPAQTVTLSETITNVDFTGVGAFSIAGRVLLEGAAVAGVEVAATNSAGPRVTATDANGNYQFLELGPATYVVRPSREGYRFTPSSRTYALNGNVSTADFEGSESLSLSGSVLDGDGFGVIQGVTVTITNARTTRSAVTDTNGNFTISDSPSGVFAVRASRAGYEFEPTNLVVTLSSNQSSLSITGYQVFLLSGLITHETNRLFGVSVQAGPRVTTTDSNGIYNFTAVRMGRHSVVPQLAGYRFSPSSASVTLPPNGTANFSAAGVHTVAGRITDVSGGPLANVEVVGGGQRTTTLADGTYLLGDLPPGTHLVRPTLVNHAFDPETRSVTVGPGDQTSVNFTGRVAYSVAGRVTSAGAPMSGIQVRVGTRTAVTAADGGYRATGIPAGVYEVRPVLTGQEFEPAQLTVHVTNHVAGLDFRRIFRLSGSVLDGTNPLANATLVISNQTFLTNATTTSLGEYQSGPLNPGTYTVSAQYPGKSFLPGARVVALGPTTNGINFAAVYKVSGRVTKGGIGLRNVSLALSNHVTLSDDNGLFLFTNVLGGSYVLTPTLAGNGFSPASHHLTLGPDQTNLSFTAFTVYDVTGQILGPNGPLAGVVVAAGERSGTTGGDGNYIISGLAPGTYDVQPALPCYTFAPGSRSVTVGPGVNNVNFSASFISYRVSGTVVTNGGRPFRGVVITLGSQITLTDTNGVYTFSNACPGTNLFFATAPGYYFDTNYNDLVISSDRSDLNFRAIRQPVVSGRVLDAISNGVGGVRIDAGAATTVTTPQGGFSFALTPGDYTLTPHPLGRLTPTNVSVTVGVDDISGIDFIIDRLRIQSVTNRGPSGVELSFLGFPGRNYTIQTSSNLALVNDWRFLFNTNAPNNTNLPAASNGFFIYLDASATHVPVRFYRAVSF